MSHTQTAELSQATEGHHSPLSPVEVIARAYLGLTGDDARVALREAIADAWLISRRPEGGHKKGSSYLHQLYNSNRATRIHKYMS